MKVGVVKFSSPGTLYIPLYVPYRATSTINGVVYLPWSDADLAELRKVSAISQDFEDPTGLLKLSEKQKRHFQDWQRPFDLSESPKMIHLISSFSIKQVPLEIHTWVFGKVIDSSDSLVLRLTGLTATAYSIWILLGLAVAARLTDLMLAWWVAW
jgi:hypothetical protein